MLDRWRPAATLLRCIGAVSQGELAGFVVVAMSGADWLLLARGNGALPGAHRAYQTSLVYTALEWAREQGMECFNLMASPAAQAGLIRYKEKFGGNTRFHCSYELPLHPARAGVLRLIMRGHGAYTRLRRRRGRLMTCQCAGYGLSTPGRPTTAPYRRQPQDHHQRASQDSHRDRDADVRRDRAHGDLPHPEVSRSD